MMVGTNDLGQEKGVKPLEILIAQVANAMTLVRLPETPMLTRGSG